ncbi:class I SAM-dependent methyltransferase [Chloroflexota bacterium]
MKKVSLLIKGFDGKMREGKFDIKQANKLDNPGRIEELKPLELLRNVAGVANGMTCIDFGSGTGTFSLPLAALVGDEGIVYALDNSAEMLERIKAKSPPPNIELRHSNVERTGLNDEIADICLLAFILHEVKKPGNLLTEAYRLLKPEGRIVIVEWEASLESPGPPRRIRISQEQIEELLEHVGLAMTNYIKWTDNHYVAIGKK